MEIALLIFVLIFFVYLFSPGIFVFFMPSIKGLDTFWSIVIGLLLVFMFGWWGLLVYLLVLYVSENK